MIAFFDFYPIVTRHDTFQELLRQMFVYTLFSGYHLLVLICFLVISFTPLVRMIKPKLIGYAMPVSLIIMLTLSYLEKGFLDMRLSNVFVRTTKDFISICIGSLMFFLIPQIFIKYSSKLSNSMEVFRSRPPILQVLFLSFFLMSASSFGHKYWIGLIILTILLGFILSLNRNESHLKPDFYDLRDYYPLIIIGLTGFLLSFLKIGYVVCNIPFLRGYFHCGYY